MRGARAWLSGARPLQPRCREATRGWYTGLELFVNRHGLGAAAHVAGLAAVDAAENVPRRALVDGPLGEEGEVEESLDQGLSSER